MNMSKGRRQSSGSVANYFLIFLICGMIIVGLIVCVIVVPDASQPKFTNSNTNIFHFESKMSLSERVSGWTSSSPAASTDADTANIARDLPDYSKEFWTPIHISQISADPAVTMCKLDFKGYAEGPHATPMFKDLEARSNCGGHSRHAKLSELMEELVPVPSSNSKYPESYLASIGQKEEYEDIIQPSGFVFHESRVGSTLIANLLGSDPYSMVYSESDPPLAALMADGQLSRDEQISVFRNIVLLMGHSPIHKRMFFKFQSISVTMMEIALEAFPDTPWAFVYRQPVQTMMSQLDPAMKAGGPCLRSKNHPPHEVAAAVDGAGQDARSENAAWCAAHLNMLCMSALRAYEKYATMLKDGETVQRGFLLNYEGLPGLVPRVLLPLFGHRQVSASWMKSIAEENQFYSKGRSSSKKKGVFSGDSVDKDARATDSIRKYGEKILRPTYDTLQKHSFESLHWILDEESFEHALNPVTGEVDWKELSSVPVVHNVGFSGAEEAEEKDQAGGAPKPSLFKLRGSSNQHSMGLIPVVNFEPWAPFSNTHTSQSFKPADCPEHPPHGYPEEFPVLDIINNWNPDDTNIPPMHYDSLCRFDYVTEAHKADNYRKKEVPFIYYNNPEVDKVVKKWSNVDYLQKKLGSKRYKTETSKTNHFMYWSGRKSHATNPDGSAWVQPTGSGSRSFEKWLETAVKGQNVSLEDRTHEYFRVSSDSGNSWLFDELPFFKPVVSPMIIDPAGQRGIHCRFGMRNIISEAHFDGSRNFVAQFGGMRRWILTHPKECSHMHMLMKNHPSSRHSAVDWSKPDNEMFPNFKKVRANEVIMQPGDVLYLPTYWIHYIMSLTVNFQCNTRSGYEASHQPDINRCGFR